MRESPKLKDGGQNEMRCLAECHFPVNVVGRVWLELSKREGQPRGLEEKSQDLEVQVTFGESLYELSCVR